MSKKSTASTASISPAIQKVFLSTAMLFITAQIFMEAYFTIRLNGGRAIGTNLWLLMYTVLFPLLLFGVAFCLHPRRSVRIPIIFESALLATAGFLIYSSLSYIGAFIPDAYFTSRNIQISWFTSQVIMFTVCGLIYIGVLYTLRRTKRW